MTAYKNFVSDFSGRCGDILDAYARSARLTNREVTLALTVASSALVVPYERIKPSASDHIASDRTNHCVSELGRLEGRAFLQWVGSTSWRQIGSTPGASIRRRHVEEWLREDAMVPIPETRNVGSVLSVLRNSLAHGNLYTRVDRRNKISELVFLSQMRTKGKVSDCQLCGSGTRPLIDDYEGIVTTPIDFVSFLRSWIAFLADLAIPEGPIQGPLLEAYGYSELGL